MSQNDFVIANQTASSARVDINSALQALASNSLGATAPSTTYAGQFWFDSANDKLKIRNEGNSAWLDFADVSSAVTPAPGYASQAEAQAGTNNTKLMTPLRTVQGAFPAYLNSANGHTKMASGLIIQWGFKAQGAGASVTFPTSFLSAVYNIHLTPQQPSGSDYDQLWVNSSSVSTSGFTFRWSNDTAGVYWMALGV